MIAVLSKSRALVSTKQIFDPAICRFINADSYASTGQGFLGYNMFAYCSNNPIGAVDSTGTRMEAALYTEGGFWEEIAAQKALANTALTLESPGSSIPGSNEKRDYYTVTARIDVMVPENVLVGLSADIYARLLYEECLKFLEEQNIPPDAKVILMDIDHIKWEYNAHIPWRYLINNCREVDFNVEESYLTMAKRLVDKIF